MLCGGILLWFFFFEKIDQKNNCHFGEILTWSENMLFWEDFRSSIQKNVILGRFSGIKNDQNSFFTLKSKNVILRIQEFQLTVHKENAIMGRFGLYICSTMKIWGGGGGGNCGTYSKISRINSDCYS